MSTFEVLVRRVKVIPHPDADSLEIGVVDGYQSIIAKGSMKTGDLAVYIPEQAILPDTLIDEMGLTGKLAGPQKNRVKAIRLRGVVSQGLLYRPVGINTWLEGEDIQAALGITKWKPEVPVQMSGEQEACPGIITFTDINPIQKLPSMFYPDEMVRMTEKLHGSCMIVGLVGGQRVISSKGIAGKGLVIKESESNVYWRAAREYRLHERLEMIFQPGQDVFLFGEVLGVQDLKYGYENGQVGFRAFDLNIAGPGYVAPVWLDVVAERAEIPLVPVLYEGPYSLEVAAQHASGQTNIYNRDAAGIGRVDHIREGVVIRPTMERTDYKGRRVIAKYVSPDYLLRKGDATEYE